MIYARKVYSMYQFSKTNTDFKHLILSDDLRLFYPVALSPEETVSLSFGDLQFRRTRASNFLSQTYIDPSKVCIPRNLKKIFF